MCVFVPVRQRSHTRQSRMMNASKQGRDTGLVVLLSNIYNFYFKPAFAFPSESLSGCIPLWHFFLQNWKKYLYLCLLAPDKSRNIFVVVRKEAVYTDAYDIKLLDWQVSNDKSVFWFLWDPNQNTQVINVGMLVLWWGTDQASCIWFSLQRGCVFWFKLTLIP